MSVSLLGVSRATILGIALSAGSIAPAFGAPTAILYPPPAGMTISDNRPTNGLMLQVNRTAHPKFLRQVVHYRTHHAPGTIVVDTSQKFLFLVMKNGLAMRYGIGVARSGFEWSGTHKVTAKREWPSWTPPAEMRVREPHLPEFMPGGPNNPMGARALYLGSTLYRIHGTNQPWSIGHNVSSGCIRMTNQDVKDLYQRIGIGTQVIVS